MKERSFLLVALSVGFLVSNVMSMNPVVAHSLAANKMVETICKVPTKFVTASQWLVKKYRLRGSRKELEVVERLLSYEYHKAAEDIVDKCTKEEINNIFKTACDCGHLQVVKFLVDTYENEIADSINNEFRNICKWFRYVKHRCETVVLEIAKLLIGTKKIINGFIKACLSGHVEIVKLFVGTNFIGTKDINRGFKEACYWGHLEVVKFFVGKYEKEITKDSFNGAFKKACEGKKSAKGSLTTVQLETIKLLLVGAKKITNGVRNACYWDHLEVVKLFFDKYKKEITTASITNGFRVACYWGHLEIVKFFVRWGVTMPQKFTVVKALKECITFIKDFDKKKKYKDKIEFIKENKNNKNLRDILIRFCCRSVKNGRIERSKLTEIYKICKNQELRDILINNLFPENKNGNSKEENSLPLSFAKNKKRIKYQIESSKISNDDFHERLGYLLSQG